MVDRVGFDTTLRVRDSCLCLHVQRAARALARRFDQAFQPLGLTHGQFSLLMSLNRPEPAAMGSVASVLAIDRSTLTAALKPLERRGLVQVRIDVQDRRARKLVLTEAGRDLLARATPVWAATHAAVEASMAEPGPGAVRQGLAALTGAAAQPDPPPT